ncbi:hypothetical protein JI435_419470 [Parastagonospora nodorum SN15]|uniref:Uncharacterized protein n=1 Tax=Phaeosphaeria nodorum (strain SN15 / ATCC MYA-4574 / FGSC 10173) TaxID=321614 RepID=A0A7U2FDS4_PHANO|nr:hypothetical protein JI435_419470 [Parastagonospora nodorum SN15]
MPSLCVEDVACVVVSKKPLYVWRPDVLIPMFVRGYAAVVRIRVPLTNFKFLQ